MQRRLSRIMLTTVTNHGLIGSQYSMVSTYADAPSGQWPAGSGIEYLWAAGLWIGGKVHGQPRVTTGQYERFYAHVGGLPKCFFTKGEVAGVTVDPDEFLVPLADDDIPSLDTAPPVVPMSTTPRLTSLMSAFRSRRQLSIEAGRM